MYEVIFSGLSAAHRMKLLVEVLGIIVLLRTKTLELMRPRVMHCHAKFFYLVPLHIFWLVQHDILSRNIMLIG